MKLSDMLQCLALGALGIGCAQSTSAPTIEGTGALGIARFVVEESGDQTVVIGLNADDQEMGRLELVHGRFTLSPPFTEDYEAPDVDGRKIHADVIGQEMFWETAGYEPLFELPSPPPTHLAIAAFFEEPPVKAVLERWQIGFEVGAVALLPDGEIDYLVSGSERGDSPQACNGQSSCGTAYYGTINTCGGGASALKAARVTKKSGTNCGLYSSSYNNVLLSQCCPVFSGGQSTPWFAKKACPSTSNNSTVCGTRTAGACKACPAYPTQADTCNVSVGSSVGSCSGSTVYPVNYDYMACYSNCTGKPAGTPCGFGCEGQCLGGPYTACMY